MARHGSRFSEGQTEIYRASTEDRVRQRQRRQAGQPRTESLGRRPLAAFGNSDGDLAMIQWTTAGDGPRFGLLVRHTDAEREWKYDRKSHIGRLDKAARGSGCEGLDRRRHEEGLEDDLPGGEDDAGTPVGTRMKTGIAAIALSAVALAVAITSRPEQGTPRAPAPDPRIASSKRGWRSWSGGIGRMRQFLARPGRRRRPQRRARPTSPPRSTDRTERDHGGGRCGGGAQGEGDRGRPSHQVEQEAEVRTVREDARTLAGADGSRREADRRRSTEDARRLESADQGRLEPAR